MKKKLWLIITVVVALSFSACSAGGSQSPAESPDTSGSDSSSTPEFTLSRPVEFMVSSKAGGNSDLFSRTIADIITQNGWANEPVVVQNNEDGNGQVSRRHVADSKTPNESLLCLSSGDLTVMVTLEGNLSIGDFRPIAILGADKQLILSNKNGTYKTMQEAIDAAKNGQQITIGGTPGDELNVLNMMLAETGLEDRFDFVSFGSSAETVTALLGGHIDLGLGKPGAAKEYVISGDLIPVLAFSTTRFPEPFDTAPTLSELGYNDVELPLYRGVVGPKNMSDEALAYWDHVMGQVAQSPEWKEYLAKSLLIGDYKNAAETKEIYEQVAQKAVEGK
ncbi:MAG TPA: tripartite tricarboxylate transporter substrate binding protein [Syntrophomonas sp.]|nr:tripartite tricarboxylate transporter substrate binding protein [Syntrophomonas sp.]